MEEKLTRQRKEKNKDEKEKNRKNPAPFAAEEAIGS